MSSGAVTCFLLQKMSKGRGRRGSRELSMFPQPDHLLALTWFHRQGVNLRGLWKITCNHLLPPALPQWQWGHRTSAWVPVLCFPNLFPEDLNLLESRVFRYHVRSALPTSCGCCGINGCNRHIFLLLEKSMSFAVLVITVMSNYSR